MNARQYILASLRQYRCIHWAVAAGVAVTTAVITGALLVGDSMRGSLRGLALQSLGRTSVVLVAEHPFRESLAAESVPEGDAAAPLMLAQGSASYRSPNGEVRRAAQLQVIGTTPHFWRFGATTRDDRFELREGVALTKPIADELGVGAGDSILLRLPAYSSLPADSMLGEKEEISATRRIKVAQILAEDAASFPARFALRPSQQAPRNVFVPLAVLQDMLDLPEQANAVAIAGSAADPIDGEDRRTLSGLVERLRPELSDYGLRVQRIALGDPPAREYLHIASDRQVLTDAAAQAIAQRLGPVVQPVVTYLANKIVAGDRQIPYSTVSGVDSNAELGPLTDDAGQPISLADDEIALNDWAAEQLGVEVGDQVTLFWYEPETAHGQLREEPPLTLKVRSIVPLADDAGRPTWVADPDFAPELPGVTDQASINDWELPFELVEPIRDEDEEYWDDYRTTPKAFVSHALAARLWGTRWGTESVLRAPISDGRTAETVSADLRRRLDPLQMGMSLLPVKRDALAAAAGTTPFDGLFLGFSFFLMASALLLTALLFRLGIEQRVREVGLLLAVGVSVRRVSGLLMVEGALVAALGALLGAALGVAYARVLVYGLNTWWIDATVTPFLELYVPLRSLLIGFAAGLLVALGTIAWSLRRFARLPARQLLSGQSQSIADIVAPAGWTTKLLPALCMAAAVALGLAAGRLEGEAQAGAFFGGGALVLAGVLLAVRARLRETSASTSPKSFTLAGLATRNARRNPSRTMLALALSATASFLIVALSAFRLAPNDRGVGGFDLLATADLPVLYDLGSPEGRRELGFSDEDSQRLAGVTILGFRVNAGQDASCLNLFQPTQPRILGAPPELADQAQFAWSAGASWQVLDTAAGRDGASPIVPMVLDRNTAAYSLKLGQGDQLHVETSAAAGAQLQVAGLLANSVLQGDLIISDANFRRLFPEEAGQRFFLIRRGEDSPPLAELSALLETELEDYGFDAVDARARLGELMAVQNTYLSTFQSLGALGLLLGVVGLAVVQLRSVLERRGELALMQSTGFRRRRLALMVLAENLVLLMGGLAIGCLAALAAVVPHAVLEQAGTPWGTLVLLLLIVAAVGAVAAWFASRAVLRAPLLPALRGD